MIDPTGKERDEETGLYYHGARYYIPWLTRWVSSDPINSENYNIGKGYGLEKNQQRQFLDFAASSYEYCFANPLKFNDPTGEQQNPVQQVMREGQELQSYITDKAEKAWDKLWSGTKEVVSKTAEQVAKGEITLMAVEATKEYMEDEMTISSPNIKGKLVNTKETGLMTDTDIRSAVKFNLYVNKGSYFYVDESNAKDYDNYPLAVVTSMLSNFVSGKGPENYYFKENGPISLTFTRSSILHDALGDYLKSPNNYQTKQYIFGGLNLANDVRKNGTLFSIPGMVGSATISITNTDKGIKIQIFNVTSLTSGAFGKEIAAWDDDFYPKSTIRDQNRTSPFGNISQTFNLFIPWGTDKGEDKYQRIGNVYNFSAWYRN